MIKNDLQQVCVDVQNIYNAYSNCPAVNPYIDNYGYNSTTCVPRDIEKCVDYLLRISRELIRILDLELASIITVAKAYNTLDIDLASTLSIEEFINMGAAANFPIEEGNIISNFINMGNKPSFPFSDTSFLGFDYLSGGGGKIFKNELQTILNGGAIFSNIDEEIENCPTIQNAIESFNASGKLCGEAWNLAINKLKSFISVLNARSNACHSLKEGIKQAVQHLVNYMDEYDMLDSSLYPALEHELQVLKNNIIYLRSLLQRSGLSAEARFSIGNSIRCLEESIKKTDKIVKKLKYLPNNVNVAANIINAVIEGSIAGNYANALCQIAASPGVVYTPTKRPEFEFIKEDFSEIDVGSLTFENDVAIVDPNASDYLKQYGIFVEEGGEYTFNLNLFDLGIFNESSNRPLRSWNGRTIPQINQNDSRWAKILLTTNLNSKNVKTPYPNSYGADVTFSKSGCGPTCLTAIASLLGKDRTPEEVYSIARNEMGIYYEGGAFYHEEFLDPKLLNKVAGITNADQIISDLNLTTHVANKDGTKYNPGINENVSKIVNAVSNNNVMVVEFRNNVNKSSSHYMVVYPGSTSDTVCIMDPNGGEKSGECPISELTQHCGIPYQGVTYNIQTPQNTRQNNPNAFLADDLINSMSNS